MSHLPAVVDIPVPPRKKPERKPRPPKYEALGLERLAVGQAVVIESNVRYGIGNLKKDERFKDWRFRVTESDGKRYIHRVK